MRKFLALLGMLAATPLGAEEQLVFTPPTGFVFAFENVTETGTLREWLPEGEELESWSRLISYTVAPGQGTSARDFANLLGYTMQQSCAPLQAELGHYGVQNGYEIQLLFTSCPSHFMGGEGPENAVIKIMAGEDAVHTVQYAWRGPITEETVQRATEWTVPQILCNPDREGAPCPE